MALSNKFGQWIIDSDCLAPELSQPCKELQGLVIFYPPATGDQGQQLAEAVQLLESNIASLLIDPPYRKNTYLLAKQSPAAELQMRNEARRQAMAVLESAELAKLHNRFQQTAVCGFEDDSVQLNSKRLPVVLVGKNLGGSIAASISAELEVSLRKVTLSGLVITGAIPELSEFWKSSSHPIGEQFRQRTTSKHQQDLTKTLKPWDLVQLLPPLKLPTLVQFGAKDDWIDRSSAQKISPSESVEIFWTDDDHAMNTAESISKRRSFIEQVLD